MITLKDENFEQEINAVKDKLVLVDFFATWCEPCSVLAPVLENLAEYFKDKIVFMKADLDNTPSAAQKFQVEKIPTVVLFKNGQPVSGFVGLMPESSIKNWLENILKENA